MGKIEVPTVTPTEFVLGYTATDMQRRREGRQPRERREEAQTTEGGEGGNQDGGNYTLS